MKLRNKKTGELGKLSVYTDGSISVDDCTKPWSSRVIKSYDSLAELNEEWEDYEEPRTRWYITGFGDIKEYSQDPFAIEQKQAIGNCFETKEEAEKAVEKLKAWKRLKDKGFRFEGFGDRDRGYIDETTIYAKLDNPDYCANDLGLLFGGEDE